MVHTWISLRNDKLYHPCQNKRILRIFKNKDVRFYGDYDLDIYLGVKNDYDSLEAVISKVISNGDGWIRNIQISNAKLCDTSNLTYYISDCGFMPFKEFKKMWPRREDYKVLRGLELRKDGNFYMYACETERYYYVICFATS